MSIDFNSNVNFLVGKIARRKFVSIFNSFSPKYVDNNLSKAEKLVRKKLTNLSESLRNPSKIKINAPKDGRKFTIIDEHGLFCYFFFFIYL